MNGANGATRKLLTAHANTGTLEEIPAEERASRKARSSVVRGVMPAVQGMEEAHNALAAHKSAALNSILKLQV